MPVGATHSIDDLIGPLGTRIFRAVEPLQVAAILESEGLNDRIAREKYGHADIFSLAEAAYSRIALMEPPRPPAVTVLRHARPTAQMLHGLLYALPAALLPAASGIVGTRWLMPALVLTTGIGWVLGSAAAQIAYSLIGIGFPRSAGRTLRTGLVLSTGVAVLTVSLIALFDDGPVALLALCVTQIACQTASGILLFYRREGWLAVMMLPAVVAGIAYIAVGDSLVGLMTVLLAVVCVAAIVGAAILLTLREGVDQNAPAAEPALRTLIRANLPRLVPSFLFAGLSAVFLLQAEARYVLDRTDIAIAGAGLVFGMGVLEYRAHLFEDQARAVIREVCYPAEFTARTRRLLAKGTLICLATLSGLAAIPVGVLFSMNESSPASTVMAVAHVTVGGAYFLTFLLANQGKVVHLCVAQAVALAVHPGGRFLLPDPDSALADVLLFLGGGLVFFVVLLVLMVRSLRDVQHYR
jgi:hypothetical protein